MSETEKITPHERIKRLLKLPGQEYFSIEYESGEEFYRK